MPQLFTNNAIALLNDNIASGDLSFSVQPGLGALFPQPANPDDYFLVTLEDYPPTHNEIVKIIDRTGDLFIVAPSGRGQEGTSAYNWDSNSVVDHRNTADTIFRSLQHYSTANTNIVNNPAATTIVDIFPINIINRSCKWLVTVINQITGEVKSVEVLAISKGLVAVPEFVKYGSVGDNINFTLNVAQVGSSLQLTITNNTSDILTINTLRMQHFQI